MPHKTLASAVEAIMNNQCSIKNDDVGCLRRACRYIWPEDDNEPYGSNTYYFNFNIGGWNTSGNNPHPHAITATEFCRLMDKEKLPLEWSPIEYERVWQQEQLAKIFQTDSPAWQKLNHLINLGLSALEEGNAEPIDLGKVFDENYDLHSDSWLIHGEANAMGREKFIEVVSKLLPSKQDDLNGWIPVEVDLPEDNEPVNVCLESGLRLAGVCNKDALNNKWGVMYSDGLKSEDPNNKIIAWQPFPEVPTKLLTEKSKAALKP